MDWDSFFGDNPPNYLERVWESEWEKVKAFEIYKRRKKAFITQQIKNLLNQASVNRERGNEEEARKYERWAEEMKGRKYYHR